MLKKSLLFILTIIALFLAPVTLHAASFKEFDTGIKKEATAIGRYSNWDGVPSVSTFKDESGQFAFAYQSATNKITVVKTTSGKVKSKTALKMKGSKFGAVTCDKSGYLYVVSGTENSGSDTAQKTVYITKYSSDGKLMKAIGNNGSSSLASYYDSSFYTKIPFEAGTCDVAINGNYLAVNYGREMYSGHQSNSVWIINCNTMSTVNLSNLNYEFYQSHSFGQRVKPYKGGFVFMSEGDCFDRAFVCSYIDLKTNASNEGPVFDFWVTKDTYNNWDMWTLNENFVNIGDVNSLNTGMVSFVGASVKSMNENAPNEYAQLFIQIFDPRKDLTKSSAYITSGKRSGLAGKNGDEQKTNYGVKWLTNISTGFISDAQAVTDGKGNTIILYGRYNSNYEYQGVYYMVVNSRGSVTKKSTRISRTAKLNPCESPVYAKGAIYWCGNKNDDYDNKLYVYRLQV